MNVIVCHISCVFIYKSYRQYKYQAWRKNNNVVYVYVACMNILFIRDLLMNNEEIKTLLVFAMFWMMWWLANQITIARHKKSSRQLFLGNMIVSWIIWWSVWVALPQDMFFLHFVVVIVWISSFKIIEFFEEYWLSLLIALLKKKINVDLTKKEKEEIKKHKDL